MQMESEQAPMWYVIHTYSGYENKVKANLEKIIENRGMQDYFFEIVVPMMEEIEKKDGKEKSTLKKVFPGYVLIKMVMSDDSWFVVRNTRGVTGFVGPGSKPIPLTEEEIDTLGVTKTATKADFKVGDMVSIKAGALEGFEGVVTEIDPAGINITVAVSMFGRETPATMEITSVEKI